MHLLAVLLPLIPFSFYSHLQPEQPILINSDKSMNNFLFPDKHGYESAWTTSPLVSLPDVDLVDLSNEALGVHRIDSRRPPFEVVPAPDSPSGALHKAWRAFFPKGSINPKGNIPGGLGFYLSGPKDFRNKLPNATEVIFGYSVMFEEDWDWVKGGKLPGIFGGIGSLAYSCSGGRQDQRDTCFNLRLMWRGDGAGELYSYLPFSEDNNARLLEVPPKSYINPDYGASVGRGAFRFKAGQWTTVTERAKLNPALEHSGEVEIRVDGETVIYVRGLMIKAFDESVVQGLHFETFFGGHTKDWACPKDQHAWFADISGAIIV